MEKVLQIRTTGTSLYGFNGYCKEKDAEKVLRNIKNSYGALRRKHGDNGKLVVDITTYNPELPYRF
jgi:hypothetical protein